MDEQEYTALYQFEEQHWWFKSMRRLCQNILDDFVNTTNKDSHQKKTLLDVGCGTGFSTKKNEKHGKVIGLDVSWSAVQFSKQRGVIVVLGSVNALPFKENTFDAVTCFEVLHHKGVDFVKAIHEIELVCKYQAVFIFRVSAYQWLYSRHDRAVHTVKRYTCQEIRQLMCATKFIPYKVTYICCFAFPFILMKRILDKVIPMRKLNSELAQTNHADFIFSLLMRLESTFLHYVNLPFGIQILGVFKKKN